MGILNRSAFGLLLVLPIAAASYACSEGDDDDTGDTTPGGDDTTNPDGGGTGDDDTFPDGGPNPNADGGDDDDDAGPALVNPFAAAAATKAYTAAETFGFGDGIVWFENKVVLTDTTTGAPTGPYNILTLTPGGEKPTVLFNSAVVTVGLATDGTGKLYGTDISGDAIVSFAAGGAQTAIIQTLGGGALLDPNDLAVRKTDGAVFFTEPAYQSAMVPAYRVSRWDPGATEAVALDTMTGLRPNGIALSPTGDTLYVGFPSPEATPSIAKYAVGGAGPVGDGGADAGDAGVVAGGRQELIKLPANSGADGLAVDSAGNIYVGMTGKVEAYSPTGVKLGSVTVPNDATSIAFGGADKKTLFIVNNNGAAGSVYQVAVNVPGVLK